MIETCTHALRPHLLWCEDTVIIHMRCTRLHTHAVREGRGAGRAIPSVGRAQENLPEGHECGMGTCPKVMHVAWMPSVRPAAPRVGVRSSSRDRVISAEGSHPFCLDASEGLGRPESA